MFIMLGIAGAEFFGKFFREVINSYISEEMTEKIRRETYQKILRMPVSWFDKPKNISGTLSSRLSSDCQNVNSSAITFFLMISSSVSTLIAGLTIAFYNEWRITLVSLSFIIVIILGGFFVVFSNKKWNEKLKQISEKSSESII